MDDWDADVDVELRPNGTYSPVLVLTPPQDVGPPVRVVLDGEYEHAELARMAVLDAMVAMTHRAQGLD